MIYISNIGLNKANNESPRQGTIPQSKMQQRRQAFNEMNYSLYQKLNQTQTTMSSTKKSNSFNTTNRLNQSYNSHAQSKIQSPRRMSLHRNSLNPASLLKQVNDQFQVSKTQKNGINMRLSQINFGSSKNENNVMHIDQILDSYRKSPSRKNEFKKFDTYDTLKQQYSRTFYTQNDSCYTNENIDVGFSNKKISERIQQFNQNYINFIKQDTKNPIKIINRSDKKSQQNSLQNNVPDSIDNANIHMSSNSMNKFLNDVDVSVAFDSSNKPNNLEEFSIQHSRATTQNARRENSISGYAIFKSSDTPLNPSFSHMDDDLSKQSFSTTSNYFRIQKRNNPYKRFYKTDKKINENNLYRYIDTQNENTPTKLSQGAFQRIKDRTDNQFHGKSQQDDVNILQYYNPVKNNMSNLIDAEGKVYKKHYMLSLQCRLDHLKKQKVQNEAQMMLINYNLINEIESTSKLIHRQLPENLANRFSHIVDSVKQNIYQNAQTQKQQYLNEIQQKRLRSQSMNSHHSEEESQQQDSDSDFIYRKSQQD